MAKDTFFMLWVLMNSSYAKCTWALTLQKQLVLYLSSSRIRSVGDLTSFWAALPCGGAERVDLLSIRNDISPQGPCDHGSKITNSMRSELHHAICQLAQEVPSLEAKTPPTARRGLPALRAIPRPHL